MHAALWIFGLSAFALGAGAAVLNYLPARSADDAAGYAFGELFLGFGAALCGAVWLLLVIAKAAMA